MRAIIFMGLLLLLSSCSGEETGNGNEGQDQQDQLDQQAQQNPQFDPNEGNETLAGLKALRQEMDNPEPVTPTNVVAEAARAGVLGGTTPLTPVAEKKPPAQQVEGEKEPAHQPPPQVPL